MLILPRSSGILLHPSSLPGRFGMGELGPEAVRWLELLAARGHSVWEMLALGPRGDSGSPGACLSGFAGDPLLISFEGLRMDGVLLGEDWQLLPHFAEDHVETEAVAEVRAAFLRLAAQRLLSQCHESPLLGHAFTAFCDREAVWLDDWALFAALRVENEGRPWQQWPTAIAQRESLAVADALVQLEAEMDEHRALQFLFHRQWLRLRAQAHAQGIALVCELPLLPAPESVDAWVEPHLIEQASPSEDALPWWMARLRHTLRRVDAVRLSEGASLTPLLEEALLADYEVPMPIIGAAPGLELGPPQSLPELVPAAGETERPWSWRFQWDALERA